MLPASASDKKKEGHFEAVAREVSVLRKLQGCLNVVRLEGVYEDGNCVRVRCISVTLAWGC